MRRFTKITITQFKNYSFSTFNFTERIIGICGLNGKGKTNLLDAIYYLSFTKSYFTKTDTLNSQFNADGFRLEGIIEPVVTNTTTVFSPDLIQHQFNLLTQANKIVCVFKGVGKKEISLNNIPYLKFSEHIGKFPCVIIAPDDVELITGGSEDRRRFIDTVISQMDAAYLQQLIVYTKVLQQRNSLLKKFAEQGKVDWTLLEVMDEQMIVPGNYIYEKRKDFTRELFPLVQQFYNKLPWCMKVI